MQAKAEGERLTGLESEKDVTNPDKGESTMAAPTVQLEVVALVAVARSLVGTLTTDMPVPFAIRSRVSKAALAELTATPKTANAAAPLARSRFRNPGLAIAIMRLHVDRQRLTGADGRDRAARAANGRFARCDRAQSEARARRARRNRRRAGAAHRHLCRP